MRILIVFLFCHFIVHCTAQDSTYHILRKLALHDDTINVINNVHHLETFYEKLFQLKNNGQGKINIVHIGDSHIQADFMTSIVRRHFQNDFGNAGRGLVIPARVAGTNEPFNIQSYSNHKWQSKRIIYVKDSLPIGIGGITIVARDSAASFTLNMNDLWLDYSFTNADIFFENKTGSFDFIISDSAGNQSKNVIVSELGRNHVNIKLDTPVGGMIFKVTKTKKDQDHLTLFGINLKNDSSGVRYHAIGVNGAKYSHYNAARYFAEQTFELDPDLFIISLGTNESLDYPYLDKSFLVNIEKLVFTLRTFNPSASFLLVTPPDSFRKRNKHNPGVEIIRNHILQFAVEHGLAFWDMYKIFAPAKVWSDNMILRPDGVHFSKAGYEYQGHVFYEALMKSYNDVGSQPR